MPRRLGTKATLFGGAMAMAIGFLSYDAVKLDDSANDANTVTVDSSISPFPTFIRQLEQKNVHNDFLLLGYGVRSVTFVGFKVYGIGLYLNKNDVPTVQKYLGGVTKQQLLEDSQSSELISKLLDNDVKFLVRINPVRNTDYGHLKDGLIKSILAHPLSKENREPVGAGLEELRQVFLGHRGSVPKDHLLFLEIVKGGRLSVSYQNTKTGQIIEMGTVNEPLISKALFLQYLSGKKPLSEPLRQSCVDGLVGLL